MITIILAGGLGKRMKSKYPKVLFKVRGFPMIVRTINNAILLKSEMIIIVVSPNSKDLIEKTIKKYVQHKNIYYVIQEKPLGTGDALKSCVPYLEEIDPREKILILNADMPLLSFFTLNTFSRWKNKNDARILAMKYDDPTGYGRIFRDTKFNFVAIKEDKDCTEEERKNKYVNAGIYLLRCGQIVENIGLVKNNNVKKEYYITDLINLLKPDIYMLEKKYNKELINVNDQETLKKIEEM